MEITDIALNCNAAHAGHAQDMQDGFISVLPFIGLISGHQIIIHVECCYDHLIILCYNSILRYFGL